MSDTTNTTKENDIQKLLDDAMDYHLQMMNGKGPDATAGAMMCGIIMPNLLAHIKDLKEKITLGEAMAEMGMKAKEAQRLVWQLIECLKYDSPDTTEIKTRAREIERVLSPRSNNG